MGPGTRKHLGNGLMACGYGIYAISGIWCFVLCLILIIRAWGIIAVVLGTLALPGTLFLFPFYVGFRLGRLVATDVGLRRDYPGNSSRGCGAIDPQRLPLRDWAAKSNPSPSPGFAIANIANRNSSLLPPTGTHSL
jgi:hypothetical protein